MEAEKVFLTIGLFSVLIAGLFSLSAFDISFTGKAIDSGEVSERAVTGEVYCKENDNGINYDIKGKIEYCDESECSDRADFCEGSILTEWYCDGNRRNYVQYNCEKGCDVGVCLTNLKKIVVGNGGGGSGGSSGSPKSSSAPEPTGTTLSIGNLAEENLDMAKYDSAIFSIAGKEYVLNMKNVAETQITATVSNTQFDLQVGNENQIDLDGDGDKDLNVKLNSVNFLSNNARITLRVI